MSSNSTVSQLQLLILIVFELQAGKLANSIANVLQTHVRPFHNPQFRRFYPTRDWWKSYAQSDGNLELTRPEFRQMSPLLRKSNTR